MYMCEPRSLNSFVEINATNIKNENDMKKLVFMLIAVKGV